MACRSHTQQLLRAREAAGQCLPHLDVIKRSVCIEGARMAFARVKIQWAKMDAVKLTTEGPPARKEHRTLECYFDDVLQGSRIVEGQCSKDIIFE